MNKPKGTIKKPIKITELDKILKAEVCDHTYADLYAHYVLEPAVRPWLPRSQTFLILQAWRGARHADALVAHMPGLLAAAVDHEQYELASNGRFDNNANPDAQPQPVPPRLRADVNSLRAADYYPEMELWVNWAKSLKHYDATQLYLLWAATQDFWASVWVRGRGDEAEHFEMLDDALTYGAEVV